ncbi:hypothetical protein AAMO2058_001576400 [Amorphochlora amoebiformis]|eukprot:1348669-Amorphochlora_amoeboformis.AAC.1
MASKTFAYVVTVTSCSKRDLYKVSQQMCRCLEINYRLHRSLKRSFPNEYNPPAWLAETTDPLAYVVDGKKQPTFRRPQRYTPVRKKFSMIKGPFVHKRSGEHFVYMQHNAEIKFEVGTRPDIPSRDARGMLRFLLRGHPMPLINDGVELRIASLDTNEGLKGLPEHRPGIFGKPVRKRKF